MPFDFKAPETSTRAENPADTLLRTFKAGRIEMILGVTYPKYNSVVVDSLLCAKNLTLPNIVAAGGGFECVPARIEHEFSWNMELPSAPPWTSQQALATEIRALSVLLDQSGSKALSNAADFSRTTRVTVRPKPNWPVIREHIYSHEMQHVCDFKWAAIQLFGPVVQMLDDYYTTNVRVRCDDRDILEFVSGGGNECIGIAKYLDATRTMGTHYHGTQSGGPPVLTFAGISANGLESYIDLTQPYATFPVSFHTGRPHQYFKVSAGGLRNEAEPADPGPRPTPAFTQETVDALIRGGEDSGEDGGEASGDEKDWTS